MIKKNLFIIHQNSQNITKRVAGKAGNFFLKKKRLFLLNRCLNKILKRSRLRDPNVFSIRDLFLYSINDLEIVEEKNDKNVIVKNLKNNIEKDLNKDSIEYLMFISEKYFGFDLKTDFQKVIIKEHIAISNDIWNHRLKNKAKKKFVLLLPGLSTLYSAVFLLLLYSSALLYDLFLIVVIGYLSYFYLMSIKMINWRQTKEARNKELKILREKYEFKRGERLFFEKIAEKSLSEKFYVGGWWD
jgi:hypothetical protein